MNGGFMEKETGDRRFLTAPLAEGVFPAYQKKILELGGKAGLLETTFLQEEETEWMMLDITGFRPLSQALWDKREPAEVIELLILLCQRVRLAEEYLFFADDLPLSLNCIYVDEKGRDLRLACLPDYIQDGTFQEHFLTLLNELSLFGLPEDWAHYGTLLVGQIREKNPGARGILRLLSGLHRQLVYDESQDDPFTGAWDPEETGSLEREEPEWGKRKFPGPGLVMDWIKGILERITGAQ